MRTQRKQLIGYIEHGNIAPENIPAALLVAKITPDSSAWLLFINRLLLWIGALALAVSCLFFIAYNWTELGRFSKFALIELLMAAVISLYCKQANDCMLSKVSLLLASLLVGVLLAFYGQTYQTGADHWLLFFYWALFILPWAIMARFPAIWIFWLALLNFSIVLYYNSFHGLFFIAFSSDQGLLWSLFIFNTVSLIALEYLAIPFHWLTPRWPVRLVSIASGATITSLVLQSIFARHTGDFLAAIVWLAFITALFFIYRKIKNDLFMLAAACLSGIVVITTFTARHLLDNFQEASFLFLAIMVVALGSSAAIWLKKVHKENL
ncbi:MAG: putative membrane protein [Psychromonas sp.]|jgi:uncharacterized membrane protein|uniref:DUF2157 domain-containing protein n=1 Tax=Psychromonas sp. TaxID=1884585 RepID=UPI0039E4E903